MNNTLFDYYNYMNDNLDNYNNMGNMNNLNNITNVTGTNNNIADAYTGYIRGNMFNNLYDQYKNYKVRELKTNNKKEALLMEIMEHYFVITDLDLYLDIYPNDLNTIKLYNKYLSNLLKLKNDYQKNYGALDITSNYLDNNSWIWIDNPWPWEGDK